MQTCNYCIDDIIEAVKNSKSIAQVCRSLGLVSTGGNFKTIRKRIKDLDLSTDHFERGVYYKATTRHAKLSDILHLGIEFSSNRLKIRLLQEKIFERKCNRCKNTHWLDNLIPLELEHKNR